MSLNAHWEITPFSLVALDALCGKPTDVDYMTELNPAAPNLWTAGSRDSIDHLSVAIAISGVFIQSPSGVFDDHSSGHCQDLDGSDEGSPRLFVSVPGSPSNCPTSGILEMVILAFQAFSGKHVGIDNLNVLRGVAGLIQQGLDAMGSPFPQSNMVTSFNKHFIIQLHKGRSF